MLPCPFPTTITINDLSRQQLILNHNALDKRRNILPHYFFGDKIIKNCLKIDATYYYDNDLLLRQETQKKIACPGVI